MKKKSFILLILFLISISNQVYAQGINNLNNTTKNEVKITLNIPKAKANKKGSIKFPSKFVSNSGIWEYKSFNIGFNNNKEIYILNIEYTKIQNYPRNKQGKILNNQKITVRPERINQTN